MALLLLWAALAGCNPPKSNSAKRAPKLAGEKYRIVVVPQGATPFWKAAREGAQDAAKKYNAEIVWSDLASDAKRQGQIVDEATAQKFDGIALAPLDPTALVVPTNRAAKAGIPVVVFGSDVNTFNKLSLVATDNYKAGQMAARRIGKVTKGQGTIGLVLPFHVSPEDAEIERGFVGVAQEENPQLKIVRVSDSSGKQIAICSLSMIYWANIPILWQLYSWTKTWR